MFTPINISKWEFLHIPASPCAHPVHEACVKHHEHDVEHVETQQSDRFIMLEPAIPGEPNKTPYRHGVKKRVSAQWAPVQMQHLKQKTWRVTHIS